MACACHKHSRNCSGKDGAKDKHSCFVPTFAAILRFRFLTRGVSAGTTSMLVAFGCDGKRESALASASATLCLTFFILHLPTLPTSCGTLKHNISHALNDTRTPALNTLAESSRAAVAATDSRPTVGFARSRRLFRRIGRLTVSCRPVCLDFADC